MCFDVPNVSGFLAWSLVPGNGCAGTLASEGLRDHCDAAEGAALVLRGVATLRRCHAAGISSRLRDFATLPRRGGLLASSRLRDAATLPRRWGLLASSRRCNAATLPRRWGLLASSRCRDAATLRRRWGCCSRLRGVATLRRCGGLLASSRLRNEILEPALCAQWKLYHLEQLVEQETRWSSRNGTNTNAFQPLHNTVQSTATCLLVLTEHMWDGTLFAIVPQRNEDCPWIFFRSLSVSTQGSFYTKNLDTELLHWGTFAQNSFYRQRLLHTEAFTQRSLYTEELLHIDIEAFAQRSLDTGAFTHRNC